MLAAIAMLITASLISCVALVVTTTLMHRDTDSLVRAHKQVDVASALINVTLARSLDTTDQGRALWAARERGLIAEARSLASNAEEARAAEELERLLAAQGPGAISEDVLGRLHEAKARRDASMSERARRSARIDQLANVLGVASALALALSVAFLVWWTQSFVLAPTRALALHVERFRRGEIGARAPEEGATDIRLLARAHNEMAEALVEQRRDQLRYVATILHDARQPLTALQLAAGYVSASGPLPPEQRVRELFVIMGRQITRMNGIIGDALGVVQADAGELTLRKEPCDALEIARACVATFERAAPLHRFAVEHRGPTTLRADRLDRVLNNLLSNAVKYSPTGALVRVEVEGDERAVTISVADEGPGVAPEMLHAMFSPFVRGPSQHEDIPGVGLGLYFVRRIVEAQGGRVAVRSALGRGSTFTVTLPREDRS